MTKNKTNEICVECGHLKLCHNSKRGYCNYHEENFNCHCKKFTPQEQKQEKKFRPQRCNFTPEDNIQKIICPNCEEDMTYIYNRGIDKGKLQREKEIIQMIKEKVSIEEISARMLMSSKAVNYSKKKRIEKVKEKDYQISILNELIKQIKGEK